MAGRLAQLLDQWRLRKVQDEEVAILRSACYNSVRQVLAGERAAMEVVDLHDAR